MSRIKVLHCSGFNEEFANITPDSVHEVLKLDRNGLWVQGVTKPVKLLCHEYVWVDQDVITTKDGVELVFVPVWFADEKDFCRGCRGRSYCVLGAVLPCYSCYRADERNGQFKFPEEV